MEGQRLQEVKLFILKQIWMELTDSGYSKHNFLKGFRSLTCLLMKHFQKTDWVYPAFEQSVEMTSTD